MLRMVLGKVKIKKKLRDRNKVERIDIRIILMRKERKNGEIKKGKEMKKIEGKLEIVGLREIENKNRWGIGERKIEENIVFLKIDKKKLKIVERKLMIIDGKDMEEKVRRI